MYLPLITKLLNVYYVQAVGKICVDLKDVLYEINTLLLLPLKIYLIILKHIK